MRIYSREGYAPFRDYVTWFRVTGDPQSTKLPVVILHGGPGAAHDYLDRYKQLAAPGRQVIHYDQLGCGKSTLLPDKGVDFWTPRLFVEEHPAARPLRGRARSLAFARHPAYVIRFRATRDQMREAHR